MRVHTKNTTVVDFMNIIQASACNLNQT